MAQTSNTQERADVNRPPDGRLVRPQEGRVIAGVALAVADRLGMSPGAVRLIWFVLGFFGGFGLLLYIAGWLLIPEEGAKESIAEDTMSRLGDATAWLGVGLIVIAAVTLITMLGWVRADLAWAVALLAVGILLYQGHVGTIFEPGGKRDSGTDVLDPGAEETEGDAFESLDEEVELDGGADVPVEPAGLVDRPAPRRRREKSILGRLTMGTVFIVLGLMAILDTSNLIRPAFSHYMAVAVGIIGIGLLVGSVLGRSRGLIFAGVVLVPIMLASSVVTARFGGGWGDPVFRPATVRELDSHYTLTGGDMEIDLRRVDIGGEVVEIEGDLGFGRLLVKVPQGVGLDLTAHVGFGDLIVFGDHNGGVDVDRQIRVDGEGVFELDLDVGFGALEIVEVSR
ncbi:MAG: PspC domain-containing protein [Acidimicrobiia bacterium]